MLWIAIFGGLLVMMGQQDRSDALFYYFRLEDQVPENHLLRLIEKHISFAFVREKLKASYSESGQPSIDPELLLRILLIGCLYGISSELVTGARHHSLHANSGQCPQKEQPVLRMRNSSTSFCGRVDCKRALLGPLSHSSSR
jgi:hypothetical protein